MSNIAIILAGGDENLKERDVPRQFTNIYDKPVLVYTLESFQRHPQIEAIVVVCVSGWQSITWAYAKQFNISKLKWVVSGGKTSQESIYNGIKYLERIAKMDDLIIIHDGIRPLIDETALTDVIVVAKEKGNAVSALPYNEQLFIANEQDSQITKQYVFRDKVKRVLTPQAYQYSELLDAYRAAFESGKFFDRDSYTDTMMTDLGKRLYFAVGSEKNIKLDSQEDFEMFKIFLCQEKTTWLK